MRLVIYREERLLETLRAPSVALSKSEVKRCKLRDNARGRQITRVKPNVLTRAFHQHEHVPDVGALFRLDKESAAIPYTRAAQFPCKPS